MVSKAADRIQRRLRVGKQVGSGWLAIDQPALGAVSRLLEPGTAQARSKSVIYRGALNLFCNCSSQRRPRGLRRGLLRRTGRQNGRAPALAERSRGMSHTIGGWPRIPTKSGTTSPTSARSAAEPSHQTPRWNWSANTTRSRSRRSDPMSSANVALPAGARNAAPRRK